MLAMEKSPNRNHKISLILALGILTTAIVILIVWNHGMFPILIAAAIIMIFTLGLAALEWVRKDSTLPLYNFWHWLTAKYISLINYWLLAICIRFIFTTVGLSGADSRFIPTKNNNSKWKKRQTLDNSITRLQYNRPYKEGAQLGNWFIHYVNWSLRTENKWKFFLSPFLLLLKIHESGPEVKTSSDNYTLY